MSCMTEKVRFVAKQAERQKKRYDNKKDPGFKDDTTYFLPVRHFNSDAPIIPGLWSSAQFNIVERPLDMEKIKNLSIKPIFMGGGYFLWHKGKGIAIDPGYGFIESLYHFYDISVKNIDVVIITHDHMDHLADLETIIMLKRQDDAGSLKIYSTQEVINSYNLQIRAAAHCEVGQSSFEVVTLETSSDIKENFIEGVDIKIIPAMHCQRPLFHERNALQIINRHFNAFGLQLILKGKDEDKRILITGDTMFPVKTDDKWKAYSDDKREIPYLNHKRAAMLGWKPCDLDGNEEALINAINKKSEEMIDAYENLKKSDIVCLHLGSLGNITNSAEGQDIGSIIHSPEYCYPGFHLGFTGCLRLMEFLVSENKFDPDSGLIVVTEFGEELIGNRRNICDALGECLTKLKSKKFYLLPSEVTLNIQFNQQVEEQEAESPKEEIGILCNYCKDVHSWKNVVAVEGPGEIITFTSKIETGKASPDICTFA